MARDEHTLTSKQHEIMRVVASGDGLGPEHGIDLDRLLELINYETTKDSMRFSIRALERRGLLIKSHIKRRGAQRATYFASGAALKLLSREIPSEELDSPGVVSDDLIANLDALFSPGAGL